jgi:hypothetical protein
MSEHKCEAILEGFDVEGIIGNGSTGAKSFRKVDLFHPPFHGMRFGLSYT